MPCSVQGRALSRLELVPRIGNKIAPQAWVSVAFLMTQAKISTLVLWQGWGQSWQATFFQRSLGFIEGLTAFFR